MAMLHVSIQSLPFANSYGYCLRTILQTVISNHLHSYYVYGTLLKAIKELYVSGSKGKNNYMKSGILGTTVFYKTSRFNKVQLCMECSRFCKQHHLESDEWQ